MPANDRDAKLDALMAQFNSADYSTRSRASAALARTKPRLQDLPALKQAFRDPYRNIACSAVLAVAKIQPLDPKVIDALIAAAKGRWECGCPQLFPKAIQALVKLAPGDPRVLEAIHKALLADNHGIRKDAIVALHKLASPAALKTLRNLDLYLGKHPLCCDQLREMVATAISDLSKKSAAKR
jgi:HEAT repeat protein